METIAQTPKNEETKTIGILSDELCQLMKKERLNCKIGDLTVKEFIEILKDNKLI